MKPAIENIIFDLGGVIISHRSDLMPYIIATTFGLSADQAKGVWHTHKDALLTGELPSDAFLAKVREETDSTSSPEALRTKWRELYTAEASEINTSLLNMVDRLRDTYQLYLLTDTLDVHHQFNEVRGIYAHFDHVFASHMEGKSKSQGVATFAEFLRKYNLQAETCVFIDDLEPYVDLAASLGIHGVVFRSTDQLVKDLSLIRVQ